MRGERPERRGGRDLLSRLNLSPAQLARIREIRLQNEGEARLLGQRARQTRRALDEAIFSDNADESMIEERAREAAAAQAAIVRRRALTELQVRRVLTPEQLSVLRDMRQQFRLRQRNRPPLDDEPRLRFPRERHNRRLREQPTGKPDN
jgi:Spy/CpxP family protein refolding chaperone